MKRNNEEMKSLHVTIPASLHSRFQSYCPEYGMLSTVVRRLVEMFVQELDNKGSIKDVRRKLNL